MRTGNYDLGYVIDWPRFHNLYELFSFWKNLLVIYTTQSYRWQDIHQAFEQFRAMHICIDNQDKANSKLSPLWCLCLQSKNIFQMRVTSTYYILWLKAESWRVSGRMNAIRIMSCKIKQSNCVVGKETVTFFSGQTSRSCHGTEASCDYYWLCRHHVRW